MSEFNPGNMQEEELGKLFRDTLEYNLTAVKAALKAKYEEEFGIFSISLDPGTREVSFAAFPAGNEGFVFSGRILENGNLADDYTARAVMAALERDVAAAFAEEGLQSAVRVETECEEDVPVEAKDAAYLDFIRDRGWSSVFLRVILLNSSVPRPRLEEKMKETVRRLRIRTDVSAYIYSFVSEEAFGKCRDEVFAKPRVSNYDIEYYAPDSKIPMWIDREP